MIIDSSSTGLPHSESHGSTLARSSPWIFAARCVLHRRLMPRHPPYAIATLTRILYFPLYCQRTKSKTKRYIPSLLLRKDVIQPQVPLRLPCYDFTPITGHTFDGCLFAVSSPASGTTGFRGVTGGVYKARERIHRGSADPRLLAIQRSRSRIADSDPN